MDVAGKYVVGFDTICEGNQTSKDDDGLPTLFDTFEQAYKELFTDAICGLGGTEDEYFVEAEIDKEETIAKMNEILASGDIKQMQKFLEDCPSANYFDEFVERAEEFVLGRRTIFTGKGIVIEGIKLEAL